MVKKDIDLLSDFLLWTTNPIYKSNRLIWGVESLKQMGDKLVKDCGEGENVLHIAFK